MKKFICVMLIVMIAMPTISVMAASNTVSGIIGSYYRVGDKYYSDFSSALDNAVATEGSTVKLLCDIIVGEANLSIPSGADVTIDLGGHTLTSSHTGSYFFGSVKGRLTVKNGKLNVTKGIVVNGGGSLTIDAVTYNVTNTSANARPAVKLSGNGDTSLTVKNSYIKTVGPGESLILVEAGTDGTINLEGDTVLEYGGVLDSAIINCATIAVQQGSVSLNKSNTDLVLNVGSKSKIVNTAPAIEEESYVGSCIVTNTGGRVDVNLEEGATLAIDREAGSSKSYHIYEQSTKGGINVNDNGANWLVTAKALAGGNVYLTGVYKRDHTVIGWSDGVRLIRADEPYKIELADEDMTFTPIVYGKEDFDIIDGAALRKIPGERAIRFSTLISDKLVETLGNKATYGTIISKSATNPSRFSGEKINCDVPKSKFVSVGNGMSTYHAAVYLENTSTVRTPYINSYSAISYIRVSYYDGGVVDFYTEYDRNNVRSLEDVATRLKNNGKNYSVITGILNTCKNGTGESETDQAVLVGYRTNASLYDGPFNSEVGWWGAGMGYVIRTREGKLMVVDGGLSDDAYGLYGLLKEYSVTDEVVVDYWFITHPDGDHVGALLAMYGNKDIVDNIDINNLVFHLPTDFPLSYFASTNAKLKELANYYGANVIAPNEKTPIVTDEAKITFYYIADDYANYTSGNQMSMIFAIELDKRIMFTGDAYINGLKAAYEQYGAELKCDVLQMPHHFLCDTGYKPFYEMVDASELMLPTCTAGYKAMYSISSYYYSTNHQANMYAEENADKVYKAFEGTFEIYV